MESLDTPWQRQQALAIYNFLNCALYLLQAFEVFQCLIPNPFEIAASIMNVESKLLSTF
jgi:hypothetical protein